jgi:hypothetical protein
MWTPDFGMRSIADVLIDDYGLNSELEGWDLLVARSISPDGRVIVGTGINPSGQIRAWWAELDVAQARSGDLDGDGQLDVGDLELLQAAIRAGDQTTQFDLNGDGTVNAGDRNFWVHDLKHTYFGDANLDGQFGSGDLVAVFVAAQYEDDVPGNSTWSTGDWNGDLEFTSGDIVLAFQDGGYERGAAALAVPEPAWGLLSLVMLLIALRCRIPRRTPHNLGKKTRSSTRNLWYDVPFPRDMTMRQPNRRCRGTRHQDPGECTWPAMVPSHIGFAKSKRETRKSPRTFGSDISPSLCNWLGWS